MMYVDPKDQDIESDDTLLRTAWLDRKDLRLAREELGQKIARLDLFIELYIERAKPVYHKHGPHGPQVTVTGPAGVTIKDGTFEVDSGGQVVKAMP